MAITSKHTLRKHVKVRMFRVERWILVLHSNKASQIGSENSQDIKIKEPKKNSGSLFLIKNSELLGYVCVPF